MTFAWPQLLWLLVAPAALLAWDLSHRRRMAVAASHPKILRAEAGTHDVSLVARTAPVDREMRVRPWLVAGLALATVALARPQWGRLEEPVFDQSREILLAVDLSRSMLTPDVKPSRLERSKLLIQSLLEKLAGERVGLVVFSGTAFLQSPLSADYEILREFLPALGPEFLPEGGTNYGALINTSIEAFSGSASADRFLIVLSDGEATDDEWKARVDDLKKKGVRVIALGVGTAAGAMIPDGNGGFVKDERGAVVLSRLENGTLQELANATGGTYRDASAWIDLAALIKETVEAGRKGQFVEKNTVRLVERFQWPLALAWWCLLVSFYFEFPVRPRVRDVKLTPPHAGHRKPEAGPLVTAAALAVLLCGLRFPPSGFAAVQIAPASPSRPARSAIASPAAEPEPAGPALGKIFRRLATQDRLTAQDYAEIARETVLWGNRIKEGGHRVPTGPVKDALQAVGELMRIDSRSTDWTKLRRELEALLENNEEKPPEQQPQPNQKDQQNQDQKNQDQSQQKQSSGGQQQQSPEQKDGQPKDQKDQNQPAEQKNKPDAQKPPGESAFGNMKEKAEAPPPPPPGDTQKVGGAQEKKDAPNEPTDPTLALPLQKLDQLRNQDSPAQLFQLMDADRKPVKKPAKDW